MRILLQPSSGKEAMAHYEDTIANGVFISSLRQHLSSPDYSKLQSVGIPKVKAWGIVPTLDDKPRKQWSDLNENDYVLFYANKKFYFGGKVLHKIHNKTLAKQWWGEDSEGRTWEYIYFIKEGKEIEVSYDPSIIGYAPNHVIQGAILLDNEKSKNLLNYIEHAEGAIISPPDVEPSEAEEQILFKHIQEPRTPDEAEKQISLISKSIKGKPVKERIKTAKLLVRNSAFSRLVKERVKYICEICGESPFKQKSGLPYAEAHHIYELSKSRIDNPREMICVCPRCHRILHYGADEEVNRIKKK